MIVLGGRVPVAIDSDTPDRRLYRRMRSIAVHELAVVLADFVLDQRVMQRR